MATIPIGALLSSLSERAFCLFSAISAVISDISPLEREFYLLLVFMLDSDLIYCFYGTLEIDIADIPPNGSPLLVFEELGFFSLYVASAIVAIPLPEGGMLSSSLNPSGD